MKVKENKKTRTNGEAKGIKIREMKVKETKAKEMRAKGTKTREMILRKSKDKEADNKIKIKRINRAADNIFLIIVNNPGTSGVIF